MKFKYLLIILLSLGLFFIHPGTPYSQKDSSDTLIQPTAQILEDLITIDIKANGSDGPLGVTSFDNVSFVVSLDPINLLGQLADWWMFIYRSPLDEPDSWVFAEIHHLGQLPLFVLPPYFLFEREFPNSNWRIHFAVDMVPNFQLDYDQMHYDYVDITSTDCFPDLPSPVLVHTGTEDYIGSDQNEYTRYDLEVTNSQDFPDDLYAEAPYLPPCGINPDASRTWVKIYDNEDNYLYGFCGSGSSEILNSLWFAIPKGTSPPECVYITLNDRFCDLTFTSNCIPLRQGLTQCVDFEDLTLDAKYYVQDTFHDSGATISVSPFQWSNSLWTNGGLAVIGNSGDAGGSGKEVWVSNVNLGFEFLTRLSGLTLNFGEYGGNLNLEINGDFINFENFVDINSTSLGGVNISVTNGLGNDQGTLTLEGEINQFAIGGQELAIDDICPQIASVEIYFTDAGEASGSIYHYQPEIPSETAIYNRPGRLTDFCFSPWSQDRIYFVNANENNILVKDISAATPETVLYTHNTYVRDVAFDSKGNFYFSESTGAGLDGRIWRLEKDGSISLFYTVALTEVDGFWDGDLTFDNNDVLYVSSGNHIPACVYEVDVLANTVTKLYTDNSGAIAGIVFGEDGLLYYADWDKKIYRLDLASGQSDVVYQNPLRTWVSDVSFPVPEIPPTDAEGVWVMPYGVGDTSLNNIQANGLTDYTDGLSGLYMEDAPFGARLKFRLESANVIPTTTLKYFRFQYKQELEVTWHDFIENVSVHYVKEKGTDPPLFPLYNLGPYDIGGKNLYMFRPHEANLPALVGALPDETVYWPKTGFFNDLFRGFLNTEALNLGPGRYKIKVTVYDSAGVQVIPGPLTFKFVVPIGVGTGGTILTDEADAGSIDAGGYVFTIHVDNRKCDAVIDEPTINLIGAGDCGFLRYDPNDSPPVDISFHATHQDNFALFRFKIVRGPNVVGITKVHGYEVSATSAGVYLGDGSGNFQHSFLHGELLGPDCFEAAFSENLYVYAKATTGWRQRINRFDASAVRAFALTPF